MLISERLQLSANYLRVGLEGFLVVSFLVLLVSFCITGLADAANVPKVNTDSVKIAINFFIDVVYLFVPIPI